MAQVISIRDRMARSTRPGAARDSIAQDAQILLFTGIRYERFSQIPERVELNDKGEPVKH